MKGASTHLFSLSVIRIEPVFESHNVREFKKNAAKIHFSSIKEKYPARVDLTPPLRGYQVGADARRWLPP